MYFQFLNKGGCYYTAVHPAEGQRSEFDISAVLHKYLTAVALNHVARPNTTAKVITISTAYRPGGSVSNALISGADASGRRASISGAADFWVSTPPASMAAVR